MRRFDYKSLVITLIKIIVGFGLIFWLVDSGKLDLTQLSVFFTNGLVLGGALLHFLLVGVLLGALRFNLLLRGLGISLPFYRTSRFQMIGLFFNVAMPGAVGGDLVKALYVIKENGNRDRTHVMMAILIDRISGMTGLFTIGMAVILFNFSHLWEDNLIKPYILMVLAMFAAMVGLHLLAIRKTSDENDLILKFLGRSFPGFSVLKKIYKSFREFKNDSTILLKSWLYSMVIQFLAFLYFAIITIALFPDFTKWSGLATIFPIGIFTVAIPISPGGLGVGHLAFERLYDLIGYKGGANVFNIYVLGYMALCLSGVMPYLTSKKKVDISDVNQLEDIPVSSTGGGV